MSPSPSQTEVPIKSGIGSDTGCKGLVRFIGSLATNLFLPTKRPSKNSDQTAGTGKACLAAAAVLRYIINYTKDHLHLDTQA